jgi:hypothetical protein
VICVEKLDLKTDLKVEKDSEHFENEEFQQRFE